MVVVVPPLESALLLKSALLLPAVSEFVLVLSPLPAAGLPPLLVPEDGGLGPPLPSAGLLESVLPVPPSDPVDDPLPDAGEEVDVLTTEEDAEVAVLAGGG